jgi:hypothetical protein
MNVTKDSSIVFTICAIVVLLLLLLLFDDALNS